ncbi:mechanosensitive ion channel family protein [Allocoleopsis franciscana]|uniref:Small-conductance mechanosensitive channel n=1 Tax=Allocoleopsis franciscana PCC 7113 TaxID=1173027 RepID=K9WL99_9CYAN|nr:mechanosensitive ion channel domain-containing protein [Allocoleopsis franciscana]AFZ20317.1 small-conductance mechanosensitive channel [Allocoleopsis franciscana PCC 7113]
MPEPMDFFLIFLIEGLNIQTGEVPLPLFGLAGILMLIGGFQVLQLLNWASERLISPQVKEVYQKVVEPYRGLLGIVVALATVELIILLIPALRNYPLIEVPVSLSLTICISWFSSRLFRQFFDVYLLDVAFKRGRKLNSEFFVLAKVLANFIILLIAVIVFSETHKINIFGLLASLGIGGLAVAFAAQKILEQLLGGIVLYIDRPFVVDDYIGLPDGVFGKVESIGLRSTKIRTSGKGTLVIVPNSSLTQVNIENFTGAKKVMAILNLNFPQNIPNEERALIQQVIMKSTDDIFGIDTRSTSVNFQDFADSELKKTQAQITFFILGSGNVSMELRRQLLDIASHKLTNQLKDYGITFIIEEPTVYVDAPITI